MSDYDPKKKLMLTVSGRTRRFACARMAGEAMLWLDIALGGVLAVIPHIG